MKTALGHHHGNFNSCSHLVAHPPTGGRPSCDEDGKITVGHFVVVAFIGAICGFGGLIAAATWGLR